MSKSKRKKKKYVSSSESPSAEPQADQPLSWGRAKRSIDGLRRPPPGVLFVCAGCIVLIVVLRATYLLGDNAYTNIATLILAFVALITPLIWLATGVPAPFLVRTAPLGSLVVTLAVIAVLFRVDGTNGDLVPRFALRWSPKPDQLLRAAEVPAAAASVQQTVDLVSTTPDDFPQFLGPRRSAALDGPPLARNWAEQPPRLLWRQRIGAGWSSFAVVNGFAVTMEQRDDQELVTCYELRTGRLRWVHGIQARYETVLAGTGPRATPTIDQGAVYALGATGILRALDGATGDLLWQKDLLADYGSSPAEDLRYVTYGRSNSPLVVGDLVVIPVGGPGGKDQRRVSLIACDKRTGAVVWEGGDQQASYASPSLATLAGVTQILIVNEASVSGHDIQSGQVLWSHPWPGASSTSANVSQAVAVGGDRVLLSKGYGGGAALVHVAQGQDGTWQVTPVEARASVLKTKCTNVALHDGYVYGLSDGILECVLLDTLRSVWKRGRYGHGQVLLVGDLLLVQAESGEVALVEASPQANEELDRFTALDGQTWNNPVLCGPLLLVRNALEAACYELPLAGAVP